MSVLSRIASADGTHKSPEALRKLRMVIQSFETAGPVFVNEKGHFGRVVGMHRSLDDVVELRRVATLSNALSGLR